MSGASRRVSSMAVSERHRAYLARRAAGDTQAAACAAAGLNRQTLSRKRRLDADFRLMDELAVDVDRARRNAWGKGFQAGIANALDRVQVEISHWPGSERRLRWRIRKRAQRRRQRLTAA